MTAHEVERTHSCKVKCRNEWRYNIFLLYDFVACVVQHYIYLVSSICGGVSLLSYFQSVHTLYRVSKRAFLIVIVPATFVFVYTCMCLRSHTHTHTHTHTHHPFTHMPARTHAKACWTVALNTHLNTHTHHPSPHMHARTHARESLLGCGSEYPSKHTHTHAHALYTILL